MFPRCCLGYMVKPWRQPPSVVLLVFFFMLPNHYSSLPFMIFFHDFAASYMIHSLAELSDIISHNFINFLS
jgi:hypothetical protein